MDATRRPCCQLLSSHIPRFPILVLDRLVEPRKSCGFMRIWRSAESTVTAHLGLRSFTDAALETGAQEKPVVVTDKI